METTRPSKQCEFCIYLHDIFHHSELPEWFSWSVQVVIMVEVVGVVQVIKFVNVYGLHGLNNHIIKQTLGHACDILTY